MSEWGYPPPLSPQQQPPLHTRGGNNCVGYCLCQPFPLRSLSPGCHEIFDFCGWFGPSMIFASKCAARPPPSVPLFAHLTPPPPARHHHIAFVAIFLHSLLRVF